MNTSGTILVTGAGGFIGSHLCTLLGQSAIPYVPMYRSIPGAGQKGDTADCGSRRDPVYADITEPESLAGVLENISTVIHLAGYAHVDVDSDGECRAVNEQGTENLLRACIENGVHRFLYVSSVLAEAEENGTEHTAYGASKLRAEERIRNLCEASQTEYIIVRPASVYGAGMAGNLANMIRRIAERRLPPLPAKTASMSLIGVGDLCEILLQAADRSCPGSFTVTVTDGKAYSLKGLENAIKAGLGRTTGGWTTPPMVLYAAFSLLNLLSMGKSKRGSRYWQKLTRDSLYSNQSIEKLNYQPRERFDTSVGNILASMDLGKNA